MNVKRKEKEKGKKKASITLSLLSFPICPQSLVVPVLRQWARSSRYFRLMIASPWVAPSCHSDSAHMPRRMAAWISSRKRSRNDGCHHLKMPLTSAPNMPARSPSSWSASSCVTRRTRSGVLCWRSRSAKTKEQRVSKREAGRDGPASPAHLAAARPAPP